MPVVGCGGDDPAAVRTTLRNYIVATQTKDYQRVCDAIYARELAETPANSGLPCEVALKTGFEDVRSPTLRVRHVQVKGDEALADVHTDAANQGPGDVTIRLQKQDGEWRIASLAQAQPQPPAERGP